MIAPIAPLLLRRRDVALLLGISESLVLQYERGGLLTPVTMPGVRAVRIAREDVEELARKIRAGELKDWKNETAAVDQTGGGYRGKRRCLGTTKRD